MERGGSDAGKGLRDVKNRDDTSDVMADGADGCGARRVHNWNILMCKCRSLVKGMLFGQHMAVQGRMVGTRRMEVQRRMGKGRVEKTGGQESGAVAKEGRHASGEDGENIEGGEGGEEHSI